jgi:hypothetical protein
LCKNYQYKYLDYVFREIFLPVAKPLPVFKPPRFRKTLEVDENLGD